LTAWLDSLGLTLVDKLLKILIIEDVPRDAEAIEEELRNEGLRFVSQRVETKEAYLAALKEFAPEIVLSDFTLPEFDALEALRLLQQHHYDIPFILVTGTRSEEVAVECIKEGADDYILKASLRRLPSSILNVLKKKAAESLTAKAEEALRRSEEQYRLITQNTHDLISLLDLEGRFIYASPSYQAGLGHVPDELAGLDSLSLVHPADQEHLRSIWQQALVRREGWTAELRIKHASGEWRIFESAGNWVFNQKSEPQRLVIVSRDVTRRKQAEEALRELPRLIREAQEAERRRVARELHDSVNQILSSVKFRLLTVEEKLSDLDEATRRDALKAMALLEKAMQEVRRISRNLRPSELDDLGLAPAIRSLCTEFQERTAVAVNLAITRLPKNLSGDLELNVYRIIQEALSNIEKHARATQVQLHLTSGRSGVRIIIQDNGRGFDPSLARNKGAKKRCMGLVDIQERAAFAGGTFHLQTAPAQGTEIVVRIPLAAPKSPPRSARVSGLGADSREFTATAPSHREGIDRTRNPARGKPSRGPR
jgi:two-component system sensor histidine kinase UhpB